MEPELSPSSRRSPFNSYIEWKRPITFVIFRICVNDAGPDTCRTAY